MPSGCGESRIATIQRLDDRDRIEYHEGADNVRVIECGARRDVGTAIVTDHAKRSCPSARMRLVASAVIAR